MHLATLFRASMLTALMVYVLVVGQAMLIPLVMAFFFWYLIKILATVFQQIHIGARYVLPLPAYAFSLLTILGLTFFLVRILRSNINKVIQAAPAYTENLSQILDSALKALPFLDTPDMDQLFQQFDLAATLSDLALALANFLGNTGLVLVYLFFIFVEQRFFQPKLRALFPKENRYQQMVAILTRIDCDVRTYIGLKTLCSFLTAVVSFAIMHAVDLDFASFWALLIFLLNYIPNIGSLIATLLPSLLALVQFPTLQPFAMVAGGVTAVQLIVANLLEPRLMGRSLNLSPLVIVLSLVLWGVLWGVVGMFLCVPITVVMMIILAQFNQTRPIAILLSRDGKIRERLSHDDDKRLLSEAADISDTC